MKVFIAAVLILSACAPRNNPPAMPIDSRACDTDTVYVTAATPIDSILHANDSLRMVNDTLARRLLHARLVIGNVRYYLNICIKRPSQDKFLKGWIRRAVE